MQSFAIIPACGRSRRMGRPKLLMPWGESTVIESTLCAWQNSAVDHIVIVVRNDDSDLRSLCRKWHCEIVDPGDDPVDMRNSIECGLRYIDDRFHPASNDAWLLAPADLPDLSSEAIDRLLIAYAQHERRIMVPVHQGKRGHPVVFPWILAEEVFELPASVGVNALVKRHSVEMLDEAEQGGFFDLDTPSDYRQRRKESGR